MAEERGYNDTELDSQRAVASRTAASTARPSHTLASVTAARRGSTGLGVPSHAGLYPPLNGGTMAPPSSRAGGPRNKVALQPGYSQLDWARLSTSGADLRVCRCSAQSELTFQGTHTNIPLRITPSELARHRSRDDAWMALQGRVYNVTSYLPFHPGGRGQLMRAAGRDGTELFMNVHSWVNAENMLRSCLVGFLVPEP